jgi:Sel1 repeat protein
LRKAADLGSREAQYTVAEMLADIEDSEETQEAFKYRLNLVEQLWACASEQGLGEASGNLGSFLRLDKRYDEALKVSHQGVKNGDSISALVLSHAFESGVQADNLNFLDVSPDDERVKRYHMISSYLSRYDYLQPKVPDLDEIVPLPPAKLPKWDGKIAFQRWYEGEAPPKPSEALMQKLANQAGLRVDNGLDLETNLPKSVKK